MRKDERPPAVLASVVVPTYARPGSLSRLLASLAAQRLPARDARFEVIVVDDGSPPGARPPEADFPAGARLIRQENRGPAAARNLGASHARGALLAFVDDDCTVDANWLAALLRAHASDPDALLGGTTRNGLPERLLSDVAESLLGFFDEDERRLGTPLSFLASNNIACGRAAFVRSGGFDASFPLAAGEDRAFCRAWLASVGPMRRVPDAFATHFHAHDLRSFWRQQRNYGRGAALFHDDVDADTDAGADAGSSPGGSASGASRRGVLPREPSFYARLLFHPLRREGWPLRRRLAALPAVALSQLAVAAGMVAERRERRRGERNDARREPGRRR